MSEVLAGIAREIITPPNGTELAGYLNSRRSRGVRDDLFVRVTLFRSGDVTGGIVSFDLCEVGSQVLALTRGMIAGAGFDFAGKLIYTANHTHTGTATAPLFGLPEAAAQYEVIAAAAFRAVKRAVANLQPAELLAGSCRGNKLAFNRRYWMKNGTVATNPGKLNPDALRPEGTLDDEITVLALRQQNRLAALIVNLVNHTDTVGGDLISADWPGRLERALQGRPDGDPQVTTLIGCSGNINHFNIADPNGQTSYAEACRIGSGYAAVVAAMLTGLEPVKAAAVGVKTAPFDWPSRSVGAAEVADAEAVLNRNAGKNRSGDMTSEGLAAGDGPVACFFAEQLIAFAKNSSGRVHHADLVRLTLGDLEIAALPAEPFTEVGLAVKAAMGGRFRMVAALSNSPLGYIAMPECFNHGGYEVRPVLGGGPAIDTAPRLIEAATKL
ncbi:MAG: hypothetical protein AB7F32_12970, partial [Victivallaceae bacterium]